MLCLGIESSCDDFAMALVRDEGIIAENIASQSNIHAVFGGVVPELASREHLRSVPSLFDELIDQAGVVPQDIDLVAVTRGPGLLGSLLVGLGFAKGLVLSIGSEFIGVNHLIAHLLAPGLDEDLEFPALGLLISGGHTQIYLMDSGYEYRLLGRTLDDAVGEAFDKTAKLLNLPYPGGQYIDALALMAEADPELFPLPYLDNQNLNFSFSGLKAAVARYIQKNPHFSLQEFAFEPDVEKLAANRPEIARVCASFNSCVALTLYKKVARALKGCPQVRSLIVAGGVAANSMIRDMMSKLSSDFSVRLTLPRQSLCMDNGSMVAYSGMLYAKAGYFHHLGVEAVPRGKVIPWDYCQRSP